MICDALRDLLPVVQFEKREKRLWRGDILVKLQAACNFTQSFTPSWVFFTLNYTNVTKFYKVSHMMKEIDAKHS